jgi:flagellar L-ring protein precursor FlgH
MMKTSATLLALSATAIALCTGCASMTPETKIQRPLSAAPQAVPVGRENNGAIFQPGLQQARPGIALFEDRRARYVGDILTVNLVERTSINRKSETTDERSASASISLPQPRVGAATPSTLGWNPDSSGKQEFKDNETNSNTVSGAITVTVIEVLANGNLAVAGEKQLTVNNDTEYIRLAGVINPSQITSTNTINSTQLADVQIESKNAQGLDKSQFAGMLARFFLTALPF